MQGLLGFLLAAVSAVVVGGIVGLPNHAMEHSDPMIWGPLLGVGLIGLVTGGVAAVTGIHEALKPCE